MLHFAKISDSALDIININMEIRPFNSLNNNELAQILDLQDEWVKSGTLPSDYQRTDKIFINDKTTLIIEIDGNIIGYSIFFEKTGFYEIDSIYVSQIEKKYKGLGKILLDATEKKIKSIGGNKIQILPLTTINEDSLVNYYRTLGYVSINSIMEKMI